MSTQNLEVAAKWRQLYALMATLGTATAFERYVRDAAEKFIMHRVELNALTGLLIQKGVFTQLEFTAQLDVEAEAFCETMEKAFPGFRAHLDGLTLEQPQALQTMQGWNQPYGLGN